MSTRPRTPSPAEVKRVPLVRRWVAYADGLEAQIAALQAQIPAPAPDPVPAPLGAPLVLRGGVVYFNDGVTPAGYSGGVQVLAEPSDNRPFWRQTTAAGSWDWVVASNAPADFVSGAWQKVTASVPAEPPVTTPPPPILEVPTYRALYAPHFMLADVKDKGDDTAQVAYAGWMIDFAKAQGQNALFVFSDYVPLRGRQIEGAQYESAFLNTLEAAAQRSVACIPMVQAAGATVEGLKELFDRYAGHSAWLYKDGDPVISFWNWKPDTDALVAELRRQLGRPIVVLACGDWWELMGVDADGKSRRPNGASAVWDADGTWSQFELLVADHPECDGWLNFVVGGSWNNGAADAVDKIVAQNRNLVRACEAAGKYSIPGWAAAYHDRTPRNVMTDDGIRAQWAGIVADVPKQRWKCVTLSTANDRTEQSGIDFAADQHFHDVAREGVNKLFASSGA